MELKRRRQHHSARVPIVFYALPDNLQLGLAQCCALRGVVFNVIGDLGHTKQPELFAVSYSLAHLNAPSTTTRASISEQG